MVALRNECGETKQHQSISSELTEEEEERYERIVRTKALALFPKALMVRQYVFFPFSSLVTTAI
jgi:hypothetical protein